jgi:hypothetical protein
MGWTEIQALKIARKSAAATHSSVGLEAPCEMQLRKDVSGNFVGSEWSFCQQVSPSKGRPAPLLIPPNRHTIYEYRTTKHLQPFTG